MVTRRGASGAAATALHDLRAQRDESLKLHGELQEVRGALEAERSKTKGAIEDHQSACRDLRDKMLRGANGELQDANAALQAQDDSELSMLRRGSNPRLAVCRLLIACSCPAVDRRRRFSSSVSRWRGDVAQEALGLGTREELDQCAGRRPV